MSGVARRLEARLPGRLRPAARLPAVRLGIRLGTLLLVHLALERWILGFARLPEASYEGSVLSAGLLERFLVEPRPVPGYLFRIGMLAIVGTVVVARFDRVREAWSGLEDGALLRLLVAVPTLLLAWAFATYDYNLYFDQAHLFDRLVLLVLAVLVLWRPAFVLPFVVLAVAIIWQFTHPIGGFSVAEPFLLVRWLLLFLAWFLLRAVGVDPRPSDFVFLAFTLLAASYAVAGLGKLRLAWFGRGDVALLLPATYANGWLRFLGPDTVGSLTRRLSSVDPLLVAGTFVVECGALLCLLRRRIFLFFLVAWPCFHLSVFALSGIFFWKWIVLEVAVLALLLARREAPALDLFDRRHLLLSVPLVLGGTIWFHPVDLSWYNAAVSYVYRFEGVGESGRRYSLPPDFFAPYDYQFTVGAFAYLSPDRQLQVVWGATADADVAGAMAEARSPRDVEALERERGRTFLDETRAARMDAFLERFVANWDERRSKRTVLSPLAPPHHLWTFPDPDAFHGQERLARVVVRRVTSFFDGRAYRELASQELRVVDVPAGGASR